MAAIYLKSSTDWSIWLTLFWNCTVGPQFLQLFRTQ